MSVLIFDDKIPRVPYRRRTAGVAGGLILAIVGAFLVAVLADGLKAAVVISFLILWIAGYYVAIHAESGRKAWRVLLISSAILCFLCPLSGFFVQQSTVGHSINKAVNSGTLAIGFLVGTLLLILGCLAGRDREILAKSPPS